MQSFRKFTSRSKRLGRLCESVSCSYRNFTSQFQSHRSFIGWVTLGTLLVIALTLGGARLVVPEARDMLPAVAISFVELMAGVSIVSIRWQGIL